VPLTCQSGQKLRLRVFYTTPPSSIVAAIQTLVDYPDTKVSVPGTGFGISLAAIEDFNPLSPPPGLTFNFQDRDTGADDTFFAQFAKPGTDGLPFTDGNMFTLVMDCLGNFPINLATDFGCQLQQAKDAGGNDVPGVTCGVRPR